MEYRIYDTQEKEYVEEPDGRWMLSREGNLYNSENDKWYTPGDRYLIEKYTYRIDKQGNKVFEGDIISKGGTNYTVRWVEKLCGFHCYGDDGDKYGAYTLSLSTNTGYNEQELKKYKIVGNIHDEK